MDSSSDYDLEIPYLQSFTYGTGVRQQTSFDIVNTNPSDVMVFKQIAVENLNAASVATTAAIYLNGVLIAPSSYMSPTPHGLGVTATGLPYLVLQMSDKITISITGATTGDQLEVQGLYTEVPRASAIPQ